jgi:hypothetical protein
LPRLPHTSRLAGPQVLWTEAGPKTIRPPTSSHGRYPCSCAGRTWRMSWRSAELL